ncbi:MFS transporter [Paenibacillus sp. JJ-223]|uniref:MFS transporter n=1 Tax=Paenibacillus sp. JJ-223 TaxID=2905647 RepID=UPI001F4367C7|nr:MFS transporter [Paenibacillus sp. JJ-223]CAH1210373.1 Riboflavin transporter RibZ [Paenibacillus sp. JJ-223]
MNVNRRWLIISVGLGILLNPLNSSMISVAVARLKEVYALDFATVSWIVFSFYVASAIAQPIMGKASDLFGRKKIFLTGLAVAFISSLLAPLSPTFGWLIVFRIIQSIGTSMMIAVGMALVRVHVTTKQGAALSVLSIFLSGAAAIGPFVGGMLIHWQDWPAIFLVNVPFVVAGFLLSWRFIPTENTRQSEARARSFREWLQFIDLYGILLFSLALIGTLVSLLSWSSVGKWSLWPVITGVVGLIAFVLFIRRELAIDKPFIPLRAFVRYPGMAWVNVQYILINVLYYALFFGVPSYLQMVRAVDEFNTGLIMLTLGLCSLVASPFAGRWVDRAGARPVLLASSALMVFGSIWMVSLNAYSSVFGVIVALAAFGIANGLNGVGIQAALFHSSPHEMIGVASGLFNTSRYLGTIGSSLLTGVIMGKQFSASGFRVLGLVLAVIAVSLVIINLKKSESAVVDKTFS